jgi:hypothetical protein
LRFANVCLRPLLDDPVTTTIFTGLGHTTIFLGYLLFFLRNVFHQIFGCGHRCVRSVLFFDRRL